MRLFIAIELNEQTRTELANIQGKLKQSGADAKWVEPQNIHLTLKFLGDVEENKIQYIKDALNAIAGRIKIFSISLSEIGCFPNMNSPRVIWAGVKKGAIESAKLASDIEEKLSELGFAKENRPFSAHLTLGRMRSPKGKQKLKEITEALNKTGGAINRASSVIDRIILFQSTLTPAGAIYTNLYEAIIRPA